MKEVNLNLKKIEKDYRTNEAYKSLRTNIEFAGDENKVLVFTSCIPNEGKSSVALSLALSLSEAGKRVMFVDADLRKSVIAGRYHVRGELKGLSHFLAGRADIEEVLYQTDMNRLHIIFAGVVPPNPSELLGGKKFESLIASLRQTYDYVIIDAPPVGSVIDAAVISKNCDAAVLVISVNTVSHKFVQAAKEQMEKSDCHILGVVLNKVDMDQNAYYGRYYGKYYGKYYGNEKE